MRSGRVATRCLAGLTAMVLLTSVPTVRAGRAEPAAAESADASELQRQGEDRYDEGDYLGARSSWLAAFTAQPMTYRNHGALVTLLVLAANATLEHHAKVGDVGLLDDMIEQINTFESTVTELAPNLSALLADERRRLEDVRNHASTVDVAPPPDSEATWGPSEKPEPVADDTTPKPWVPLVIGGGVAFLGGASSIIAGAAFGPRARSQIEDSPDPAARTDAFVTEERNKGLVWVGVGSALVVTGAVLVTIGLLRRARGRKPNVASRPPEETPRVMLGGIRW